MNKKNIVLIGFAGCGKSTVGRNLAHLFDAEFIDSDEKIIIMKNKSITEIFELYGEEEFRKIETEAIEALSNKENAVISTGGGCVKNPENMRLLKKNGTVIYLSASPEKIFNNIASDNTRPLLKNKSAYEKLVKITKMLEERVPLYEKYADIVIDTNKISALQAAYEIMQKMGEI